MALTPTVNKLTTNTTSKPTLKEQTIAKRKALEAKMADPTSDLNKFRATSAAATKAKTSTVPTLQVPTVEAQTTVAPVVESTTDIQNQMVDATKNDTVAKYQAAFKNAQALAATQQADLITDNRTQTGQLRTDDTMARAATAKIQAGQGLSGAGSASQSDTAQNVIQQGATTALTTQTNQLKADINAQLAEAQNTRDQGIATAESEANIVKLQNKLSAIERAEATATANEATAKADYLTTIGQFQGDYQTEINRVLNDDDPTNDWQADFLKTARQGKIQDEGLDQQGNALSTAQGLVSTEAQEALSAYNSGFRTQGIIDILNNAGYEFPTATTSGSYSGGGTTTTTAQDMNNYNLLKTSFAQGNASGNEAIAYIANNEADLVAKYGQNAVTRMVDELYQGTLPQEQVETPIEAPEEVQEIKGYTSYIDDYLINPSVTDPLTGAVTKATVNVEGVKSYVRNLYENGTINDVTADQLLSQYGL